MTARSFVLGSVYLSAVGQEEAVRAREAEVLAAARARGIEPREVPADDLRPLPPAA